TRSDDDSRRRVVVLGADMVRELDLPDNPVGEFVQIGSEWFKVIGVAESLGEVFGFSQDAFAVMPFQTALSFNSQVARPDIPITFTVDDPDMVENVKQRVSALMRRTHGIGSDDLDDFRVESSQSFIETFNRITGTITAVVAGVVGISVPARAPWTTLFRLGSVTRRAGAGGIAEARRRAGRFAGLRVLVVAGVRALGGGLIGMPLGVAAHHAVAHPVLFGAAP